MKDFNKNYRIPARITEFRETENKYLTKAKLEIFYIGETVDKRLFTENFSKELLQTVPQMPVVAYYDEEKEDFIGHNDVQHVYGYVPEITELEFRERDNKTYAVTDVLLFTGRDDNIGEIANKIVGKSQSLEMDPASVTYKINKEDGKFKNIEFTSGNIVGMSVLGDDENPAFTGSHFFKEKLEQQPDYAEAFVEFIKQAKQLMSSETGGVSMDKFLEKFLNNFDVEAFIKKTYDEERMAVHSALAEHIGHEYFYIVQMNSETVVYYGYNAEADAMEYSRVDYTVGEEDAISFGDIVEVKARYLTSEEIDGTFSENVDDETDTEETEDAEFVETTTEEIEEEETEETEEFTASEEEEETVETTEEEAEVEFTEEVSDEQEEETEDAEEAEETFTESDDNSASETFTSEDKRELEEFRTKEKLGILNKYEEYLTEDEQKSLIELMPNCNAAQFEKEIKVVAFEAMQTALLTKNTNTQEEPVTRFTIGNVDGTATKQEKLYAAMKNLL